MIPERLFALIGAISGMTAVAAGAFASHALKQRLPTEMLDVFETAARYQIYHALAMIAVAWAAGRWGVPQLTWAGWLFVAGTVLFSGSLYTLALSGIRTLGAVTPLGGICFLAGWACMAWGIVCGR